jgi:bifunctional non-homologous end joining protein LigD
MAPRDPAEKRRGARDWLLLRGSGLAARDAKEKPARARSRPGGRALATTPAAAAGLFALATLVDRPPEGRDWVHETKWDGYRMLAAIEGGRVTLWSRSGGDWSERLPELVEALATLRLESGVVDGEVVAVARGKSGFQPLQNTLGASPGEKPRRALRFVAFDLLAADGEDLRPLPLVERKRRLAKLLAQGTRSPRLLASPHRVGRGGDWYARACARGLEGIVSKRADAPYRPGRGRDWLKTKCHARQEFVIAGYTPAKSAGGDDLGALLLATRKDGALAFAGKVGNGFDRATRTDLLARRRRLEAERPAVEGAPRVREARWVAPRLVAEVEFSEWTGSGRLRHPSFVGLREDKPASAVRAERPVPVRGVAVANAGDADVVAGIRITHPDRKLFPGAEATKLDVARYYARVWPLLEPHLADRPLAFVRCPEGATKTCFFQKHWPEEIAGVAPVDVSLPGKKKEPPHARIASLSGLVALAQRGALEVHLWGSRARRLEFPDRLVFDLDPGPGVDWSEVVAGARLLRSLLAELGLESFALTSGGKGLHVVAPLAPRADWATFKAAAAAIAGAVAAAFPDRYVDKATKSSRTGKIFVDYLRNGRGATAIAPFSVRARAGAPIAMPITWQELARSSPDRFTLATVGRRLGALEAGRDPWAGYFEIEQSLTATTLARLGLGPRAGRVARSSEMATRKRSSGGRKRYGAKAAEKVEEKMHELKRGELTSGRSGKKVKRREQAIAIGLSEARREGGKVPPAPRRSASREK